MTPEELLRDARNALHRGDRQTAATLFARIVQRDPGVEEAWLGLGLSLNEHARRIYCLKRALVLNPENQAAREFLESLTSAEPAPKPEVQPAMPAPAGQDLSSSTPQITPPTVADSIPHSPPVTPAFAGEPPLAAEAAPGSSEPQSQTAMTPSAGESPPAAGAAPGRKPARQAVKRKPQTGMVWFFVIFVIVLLLASAFIYALASGLLDSLLPGGALPLPAGQPSLTPELTTSRPSGDGTATSEPGLEATTAPLISYTPLFEAGDCPFTAPGSGEVNCGVVILPENRRDPETSLIRLAVAVYQPTGTSPAADPVIFLQGGPGAGAVTLSAEAYPVLVEPFLEKHVMIVFDQRGTGLSEPVLPCDELTQVYSQDLRGLITPGSRDLVYQTAFRSCHDQLSFGGVDFSAYSTLENAADVKDVLLALGYNRANLFAVSYGTRLGQVVMREYPEIVRSAVLDSMLPLDVNVYVSSAQTNENALRTLFDGCAADATCAAAFPDLEADFWSLVEEMDAIPIQVPVVVPYAGGRSYVPVDGRLFLNQVIASLKQTWMIPGIPLSIDQVRGGDISSLSYTLGFPPVDWELDISLGMYISIMCHEYIMAAEPDDLAAGLRGEFDRGEMGWFPFVGEGEDYIDLCEIWDSVPPARGEADPLVSAIPTLILAGKYDSITPPEFGQRVAANLSKVFYLEFPDQGHAPSASIETKCPMETVLTFLDHPETGPDSSCLADEKPPRFIVPYTGAEAIALARVDLPESSIQVNLPVDWIDWGSGSYARAASGLDITQLLVLRVEAAPAQTLSILSERQFYGRMMLDEAPTEAETRTLGAFTWKFYRTTSFGTPVDLALANDSSTTLLVMLFTHLNERDALYENVFIPVVSSVRSIK